MKSALAEVTADVASGGAPPKAGVWEKNPPAVEEKPEVEVGCPKSDVWVTEAVAGCPKGVVCVKVVDEGWPNKLGCDVVVEGSWPKRDVCAVEVEVGWPKGVTWGTVVETGCCPNGVTWGTVVEAGCCPKGVWVEETSLEVDTSVLGVEKKDGVSDCGCPVIWELDVVVGTSDLHILERSEEAVETACPNKTVDGMEVWGGSVVNGGEGGLEMDKLDCEVIVSVLVTDETAVMVADGIVLTTDSTSKVESERFTASDDASDKNAGCFNSPKSELLIFNSLLASTVLSAFGTFVSILLDKTVELVDLFTDFKESTNMFCSWLLGDWVRAETVLLTEFKLKLKPSPDRKPEFVKLSSFFVCCSALFDPKKNPGFFNGRVTEEFSLSWELWEGFFSAVITSGADIVVFGTVAIELDDTMIIELELCSRGLSCWIHFEFSDVTLLLKSDLNVDTTVGGTVVEETDQNESLFCPNWKPAAGNELELLLTVSGLETLDSESFRMLGAKENGLEKIVAVEETGSETVCLKSGDFISAANENLGNSLLFFTLENRLEPTPCSEFYKVNNKLIHISEVWKTKQNL